MYLIMTWADVALKMSCVADLPPPSVHLDLFISVFFFYLDLARQSLVERCQPKLPLIALKKEQLLGRAAGLFVDG